MTWLKEKSFFILASTVLGIAMVLFLAVPIVGNLVSSAPTLSGTFSDVGTLNAIFTSFYCALLATAFTFILGIPFAYMFTRYEFPGKKVIDSLIDLPILIPHNAAGIALLTILSPHALFGGFLNSLGVQFIDTILGIVVAMAFVSAPFMIRSAQEAFASVDPTMEKVAVSLGASRFKVFLHITIPLALRGILMGCILTWARSMSEFGAVVVLAYYPKTIPVYLYDVFSSEGLKAAIPISGLLLLLAIVVLIVFRLVTVKPARLVH